MAHPNEIDPGGADDVPVPGDQRCLATIFLGSIGTASNLGPVQGLAHGNESEVNQV